MLAEAEFDAWCRNLNLSEKTVVKIQEIRTAPPSRRVNGGKKSVSGHYPSGKMKHTIQFESHRNELARIYEYEFFGDVLEYWDQPPSFHLDYLAKSGRRNHHSHTPDFFVIRKNSAGWEECKTERELIDLAEKSPNRWLRESDGKWRCPPGEQYAEKFGLYYAVLSSATINSTFVRNFEWLEDYFLVDPPLKVNQQIFSAVQNLVSAEPGIALTDVYSHVEQASADDLNVLIATRQIFIDLNSYPLCQPEKVKVFPDEKAYAADKLIMSVKPSPSFDSQQITVEVGATISWDGEFWKVINTGKDYIGLMRSDGYFNDLPNNVFQTLILEGKITGLPEAIVEASTLEVEGIWKKASKSEQEQALNRYKRIEPILDSVRPNSHLTRNERRWLSDYLKAEKRYGNGFIGLLPKYQNRGWRRDGIATEVRELMEKHIEDNYETVVQHSIRHVYNSFDIECKNSGYVTPSYEKYRQIVGTRPLQKQIERRMGARAAYKEEDEVWYLNCEETPQHGDRSFQTCHIDHTEVDVELTSEIVLRLGINSVLLKDKPDMGRAWLTIMIDAYDRRILAAHMTFDPPSYRLIMKVLRICVKKHKQLPRTIVVDNGPEFNSTYFEVLLAWFRINKKERPKAKPRYGTVIENFFGVADKEFWHQLQGNTQIMKNVRQVTQQVNPKNHAVWTLSRLYAYFSEYCLIYNDSPHPALRMTPNQCYEVSLARSGFRKHKFIAPEEFNLIGLPSPKEKDGKREVTQKGIKVHYIWYWHDSFKRVRNTRENIVDVKYDPFDISLVYACVKGEWVKCHPKRIWELEWLEGRSEKEWMIATEEIKRLNKLQGKSSITITGQKLAEFFKRVEMAEAALSTAWREAKAEIAIQHWRDVEQQFLDALVEGKSIEPETAHLVKLLNLPVGSNDSASNLEIVDAKDLLDEDFESSKFNNEIGEQETNNDNHQSSTKFEVW